MFQNVVSGKRILHRLVRSFSISQRGNFQNATSGRRALENAHRNRFKRWSGNATAPETRFEAKSRLWGRDTATTMGHNSKFKISRDEAIFTVGSCFARNIEDHLVGSGFSVPTADLKIDPSFYSVTGVRPNGVLNRYSVHSIANEFARTFGRVIPKNRGLIAVGDDLYWDPQAALTRHNTLENCLKIRDQIEKVNQQISRCKIVLITLGLTEGWYDEETGTVLNGPPLPRMVSRSPDRYVFFNATPEEALGAMKSSLNMIWDCVGRDVRFIITTSPVPLYTTFTEQDIIVANTYSKSVLRAVAQNLANAYENVDYFPSYEMVVNSDQSFAWGPDRLHVSDAMVASVVQAFKGFYVEASAGIAA